MNAPAVSRELIEALTNMVGARMRLNRTLPTARDFDKRHEEWERAAKAAAERAQDAGFIPEGIEWG